MWMESVDWDCCFCGVHDLVGGVVGCNAML